MTATALTLTSFVPEVLVPKRFISGVRKTGVVIPLPPVACSSATRTPFAVLMVAGIGE